MARKPKAKRPGRPSLPRDERLKVLSVRVPGELIARVRAQGKPQSIVKQALELWLDRNTQVLNNE